MSDPHAPLAILIPDDRDVDRYDDWREQAGYLEPLFQGVPIAYVNWASDTDLRPYRLVLPLMAWGYHRQPGRWLAQLDRWEDAGVGFANALPVIRMNSDKAYLATFAAQGVPIVPTRFVTCLDDDSLAEARAAFGCDTLVVKPAMSAGSDRTFRVTDGVPPSVAGAPMLVQPLIASIATAGELSLFYAGGQLAHAIVKRAAEGDFRIQPQFGGTNVAVTPPPEALEVAKRAMAAAGDDLLYARVDLVQGDGGWLLMEIELIEPWLYLHRAHDGGAAFARAVLRLLS